jgi:hypothetical protein|tara:strand:+ start:345 stop:1016 length:672 start_codon:yes stop_codon:yes gene_type:complete
MLGLGIGLGLGGALASSLFDDPARDVNIQGVGERRNRLQGLGQQYTNRQAFGADPSASIGQMGGLYDELAMQRATAGERSRMQARGAVESAGRDIRGMVAGAGPQNQAMALRQGMQGLGQARMGEARMAREGELNEIDMINRQRAALLASKGGLEAQKLGLDYGANEAQRRLNAQMQQYAIGQEADEAHRQAALLAGMPTQGEQIGGMISGLGSALMMGSGQG